MWYVSTCTYLVSEYIPFSTEALLILLMSAFFCKKSTVLGNGRVMGELCKRFFFFFSVFVREMITVSENVSFTNQLSRIRLPDCSKLAINRKNDSDIIICWHDNIIKFFWCYFASLVKFSYWSKFQVNIITSSRVTFIRDWPEICKIGNTPIWVLPNIWGLGQVRDIKFGTDVPNKMLLNAGKYQGFNFYCFWVIKRNQQGVKIPPRPTHTHPD